jgi:hypothetical protein
VIDDRTQAERQATQDVADIIALRGVESFNRYWLRRLAQKREEARKRLEDDPPDKCDKDEREIQRRLLKAYKELEGLMAVDEAAARKQLDVLSRRT